VVIPDDDKIERVERRRPPPPPEPYLPYHPGPDGVAPMACFGDGHRMHVTGLTHDERGYPVMDAAAQQEMVERITEKVRMNAHKIASCELTDMDDAEVAVVAYGISARSARRAVRDAREQGIRAGLVKLNTVWPFPEQLMRGLAGDVRAMVMPEINLGQMVLELERSAGGKCPVRLVAHAGGSIIRPAAVLEAIAAALKEA
jgi:2-oxoglutarate ferredoxin oxidoreductase subunit alpha